MLMIFDTASVYFRAFFGRPESLRAADGTPVNAVHGMLDQMARLIDIYRPTHIACAMDVDWRPDWRVELVPSYKTHRLAAEDESGRAEQVPASLSLQLPIIEDVLDALHLARVGAPGFEADDICATLAATWPASCVVVSGDRDLFQLAHDNTQVVYIGRGVARRQQVDSAWVEATYGVPAASYADLAVLRGDPSDGLPGVAGIGEKTAASLVRRWGSLERMVEAAADPASGMAASTRASLGAAIGYLAAAREVVTCVTDLPLPPLDLAITPPDAGRCERLAQRWKVTGPMTRIRQALETAMAATPPDSSGPGPGELSA